MNSTRLPHRRAIAALLSATALAATPALAQETQQASPVAVETTQVAPPPATPAPVASAPRSETSATPVNPEAAAAAEAEEAADRAARPVARSAPRRATPDRVSRPRAAAPAAPASSAASTSQAPVLAPSPTVAAPVATSAPAASAAAETVPAATPSPTPAAAASSDVAETRSGGSLWPFLLAGLAILAAAAFFLSRRRRADIDAWEEPTYVADPVHAEPVLAEPVYVEPVVATPAYVAPEPAYVAPLAAVPAVADDATIADADSDDVAALTAASTVTDRPWLEFAMRPVRAGTNVDEALVEIELTVGNAGAVTAHDVRIATFMLDQGSDGEVERLLTDPPLGAEITPVTIEPGEGTRLDTTIGLPKSSLTGAGFRPIVIADARYRMADGSEGRTSASFEIGVTGNGSAGLLPIDTASPLMREDIEARLYRDPQHA